MESRRCCGKPIRRCSLSVTPGIVESYGTQWPDVTCIDFWVYRDAAEGTASTSTEGWTSDHEVRDLPLTGDGILDGRAIGAVMARILQVDPPLA